MKKHKICIVGGGLTGLISALVLSERGLDIDLILENNTSKNKDLKNETNYLEGHQPFLNFDFMSGVPVFIFNDRWTVNGAQSSKVIETAIDIAAND